MQRHDVASTLRRRCINVMCPLGIYGRSWIMSGDRFAVTDSLGQSMERRPGRVMGYAFVLSLEINPAKVKITARVLAAS